MFYTLNKIIERRRFRKLIALLFFVALVLSQMIVPIERQGGGNIRTWFDGIWWASTTLTTVGYGDLVPITTAGRIIAMVLQFTGAIMFGVTIAMIGSILNRTQDEFNWRRSQERLDQIEQTLERLEKQSSFIVEKEAK